MTNADKLFIDNNLKNFDSFIEFHKFLFLHDIELTLDEWENYRDKLFVIFNIKESRKEKTSDVVVDLRGLILP